MMCACISPSQGGLLVDTWPMCGSEITSETPACCLFPQLCSLPMEVESRRKKFLSSRPTPQFCESKRKELSSTANSWNPTCFLPALETNQYMVFQCPWDIATFTIFYNALRFSEEMSLSMTRDWKEASGSMTILYPLSFFFWKFDICIHFKK